MFYQIKQPETEKEFKHYYHLRWKLLRAPWNQPEGSEVDTLEEQCFHVMAIDNRENVIAVARLQFNTNDEAQIRYMAVSQTHRNQGIARELMKKMEQHVQTASYTNIILDARETAVAFYKKLGYHVNRKSYLLFDEIQHFRMSKSL